MDTTGRPEEAQVPAPGDRLLTRAGGLLRTDRVLNRALPKVKCTDKNRRPSLRPSGIDSLACVLTRAALRRESDTLALALPRGEGPLPALIGLYHALWQKIDALSDRRARGAATPAGSVSVASTRPDLRQLARGLSFDGLDFSELIVPAKLVSIRERTRRGGVRRRAAAAPLRGGQRISLLSRDSFLLFHRPLSMPPVARGLIKTMVVDAAGIAREGWPHVLEQNRAACRRQIWMGQLGDSDFERFCDEHGIPLVRFDWPLLAACAQRSKGAGPLSSTQLATRVAVLGSTTWHLVVDEERDNEFAKVYESLREMCKRGSGDRADALRAPYRLAGLLARLACPLEVYARVAAVSPYAADTGQLLVQCTQVSRHSFVGNAWQDAYDDYWPLIVAGLRNLIRFAQDGKPGGKEEALVGRVVALMEQGTQVRILCQTRAEVAATRDNLSTYGITSGHGIRVASYEDQIQWGARHRLVTLLVAPPPPWRLDILLSGEEGHVEVLCYSHEAGRLRSAMAKVLTTFAAEQHNEAVADRIGLPGCQSNAPMAQPSVRLEDGFLVAADPVAKVATPIVTQDATSPDGTGSTWEEILGLYARDLPLGKFSVNPDDETPATYSGLARLVTFSDSQPVFFRDDVPVTTCDADGAKSGIAVASTELAQLRAGMAVVFLPGLHRRDLLGTMMDTWDERLDLERRMFQPLFEEAVGAAIAAQGLHGVATACGLGLGTIRNWLSGKNWPQGAATFQVLLDLAALPQAFRARAPMWAYFGHVRGAHRYIGRLLNEAVTETIAGREHSPAVSKLSRLIGRDVSDIFDQLETATVSRVGPPQSIPLAVCGQFLDPDDPYLHKEGYA